MARVCIRFRVWFRARIAIFLYLRKAMAASMEVVLP